MFPLSFSHKEDIKKIYQSFGTVCNMQGPKWEIFWKNVRAEAISPKMEILVRKSRFEKSLKERKER